MNNQVKNQNFEICNEQLSSTGPCKSFQRHLFYLINNKSIFWRRDYKATREAIGLLYCILQRWLDDSKVYSYLPPVFLSDERKPELKWWPLSPMTQNLQIGFVQEYGDLRPWCWGSCQRLNCSRKLRTTVVPNQKETLCVSLRTEPTSFLPVSFLPQRKDMGGKHTHIKY